jgi:hypothetical protein
VLLVKQVLLVHKDVMVKLLQLGIKVLQEPQALAQLAQQELPDLTGQLVLLALQAHKEQQA